MKRFFDSCWQKNPICQNNVGIENLIAQTVKILLCLFLFPWNRVPESILDFLVEIIRRVFMRKVARPVLSVSSLCIWSSLSRRWLCCSCDCSERPKKGMRGGQFYATADRTNTEASKNKILFVIRRFFGIDKNKTVILHFLVASSSWRRYWKNQRDYYVFKLSRFKNQRFQGWKWGSIPHNFKQCSLLSEQKQEQSTSKTTGILFPLLLWACVERLSEKGELLF